VSSSHPRTPHTRFGWLQGLLVGCLIYALLDVTAAQICKRTLPWWDPWSYNSRYSIKHPTYHHDIASNLNSTAVFGNITYPVRTNSLGFRDSRVRAVSLRAATPRVVFIGDSFTEGSGVPYPETYVGLLDRHLRARGVEVLNAAAPGYAFAIYRRKLEHLLNDVGLHFDYLVVGIDMSDVYDDTHQYKVDREGRVTVEPERPVLRLRRFLRDNSLLLKMADGVKELLMGHLQGGDQWRLGLLNYAGDWTLDRIAFEAYGQRGLQMASSEMEHILALTRSRGIGMAIVVWPWPNQIAAQDSNSVQVRYWSQWAQGHQVAFFDLFPTFLSGRDPVSVIRAHFVPYDVHWNASGHRLVGQTLIAQGLPDSVLGYMNSSRQAAR
jgi:hypothetical protein